MIECVLRCRVAYPLMELPCRVASKARYRISSDYRSVNGEQRRQTESRTAPSCSDTLRSLSCKVYGMYRAVSELLASRDDPFARADGVAHAAPVVRVLVVVLWLGLGYG